MCIRDRSKEVEKQLEAKLILNHQKKLFDEHLRAEKDKISREKKVIERNERRLKPISSTEIIEMNIGGTHMIATTKETLCKDSNSVLATMFNGKHKLKILEGRVFIDRDGDAFCMLLSYLRNNKLPLFESKAQENIFYEELNYWGVSLDSAPNAFEQFDADWCAPTLRLTSSVVLHKHEPFHGVVFCSFPITSVGNYVEFRVVMQGPLVSTKSSLFVGLVDRSLYRKEQLISNYWKDSPSSFYCDVWSCRLEKVDKYGRQTGMAIEYGCGCQEEGENYVGMLYDEGAETLTFYKNGLCMGTGFRNVPPGLYPAVDVWFENGYVEIVKRNTSKGKIYLCDHIRIKVTDLCLSLIHISEPTRPY
eukprot:TRINITY_DN5637_c0_g2_i7.p1 TRINITY_DN5637_c0_g2~~TRINITY_DN5637_c0_g2_i7.p1  ORF type:complete len:362 (-),score=82.97 TRINITY_DN5637_c0_g2_i7:48-1133(-)